MRYFNKFKNEYKHANSYFETDVSQAGADFELFIGDVLLLKGVAKTIESDGKIKFHEKIREPQISVDDTGTLLTNKDLLEKKPVLQALINRLQEPKNAKYPEILEQVGMKVYLNGGRCTTEFLNNALPLPSVSFLTKLRSC